MFTGNLENYPRNILHFPSKGWDAVSNGALFRLSEIYILAYLVSYDISIYAIRFNLECLNRRDEFTDRIIYGYRTRIFQRVTQEALDRL